MHHHSQIALNFTQFTKIQESQLIPSGILSLEHPVTHLAYT